MNETPIPAPDTETERIVEIRTAPSYRAFIALGVVLGLIAAIFVTLWGYNSEVYTFGAVYGVMAVICGAIGALLGAMAALIIDKAGLKRAQKARAIPTE